MPILVVWFGLRAVGAILTAFLICFFPSPRLRVTPAPGPAALDLTFDVTPLGTRLASRRRSGPLVVQRALYPEGPSVMRSSSILLAGSPAGTTFA